MLQVTPKLGQEAQTALENVKETGGDPTAALNDANNKLATFAGKLSTALSAKLSCDPGKSVFEIPAGGADPCDVASLGAAVGEAVTVNHQLTARVLGVSCRVQPKTKTGFTLGLSCDAQLKKAVPLTEANAAFATADHNAGSQAKSVTDGGLEAFETPATFQAKLRINNTICVLFMETGGSSIDAAAHAVLVAVAQGLKPRFVDKNTFISEGGSSAVAN